MPKKSEETGRRPWPGQLGSKAGLGIACGLTGRPEVERSQKNSLAAAMPSEELLGWEDILVITYRRLLWCMAEAMTQLDL